MSNKNRMSSLVGQLSKVKSDGIGVSRLVTPVSTATASKVAGGNGSARPVSPRDSNSSSIMASGPKTSGLSFGKAPSSATKSTISAGTNWAGLLKNVSSGGVASAFGGGLLSAIGGLGGLVSGIAGLFGGSKAPAPLSAFQLPGAVQQTASLSRNQSGSQLVSASHLGGTGTGIYGNANGLGATSTASNGLQSQQVAQAVKQALLTSSSLNDVIAEI